MNNTANNKSKKVVRWVLIIILTVAVMVAGFYVVLFLADNNNASDSGFVENPVVDLNKFINITAEGYDGYGRIKGNIDIVHRMDYKTISYKEKAPKINSTGSEHDAATFIYQNLEIVFSKNEKLCNGDVITYKVEFKNLVDQLVDCEFINTEGTFVVENLEAIEDYDPFDNLEVSFSGASPYVYITYNVKDTYIGRSSYIPDADRKLKNGDKVTFEFKGDCEQLLSRFGKNVSVLNKEYLVDGMPEYVLSEEELSAQMLEELQTRGIEAVKNTCIAEYEDTDNLEYVGLYLYAVKEYNAEQSVINRLNVVYKSVQTISGVEHLFYYPVSFINLQISDGTLEYTYSDYVDYFTTIDGVNYTGIDSVEDLQLEMVTRYEGDYNIEIYDGIE